MNIQLLPLGLLVFLTIEFIEPGVLGIWFFISAGDSVFILAVSLI